MTTLDQASNSPPFVHKSAKTGGSGSSAERSRYIRQISGRPFFDQLKVDHDTGCILGSKSDQDRVRDIRAFRYGLLDTARDILASYHGPNSTQNHQTWKCSRVRYNSTVQVLKHKDNKAFYKGVIQCGRVWTCPVCSPKIGLRRGEHIRLGFNMAKAQGLHVSLVTFTAPHTASDDVSQLIPSLKNALRAFNSERQIKKLKKDVGFVGSITSFELLYGPNGWHPHFHIVYFTKTPFLDCKETMLHKWQACCQRNGLDKPNDYGIDIQNGDRAGEYINKFGNSGENLTTCNGKLVTWDLADEMTNTHSKNRSKNKLLTPWQMLEYIQNFPESSKSHKFRVEFHKYAKAVHGKARLNWSRGLASKLGIDSVSMSDEEIVNEHDSESRLLCHLMPDEWKSILKKDFRAQALNLVEVNGISALIAWLHKNHYKGDLDIHSYTRDFLARNVTVLDAKPSVKEPCRDSVPVRSYSKRFLHCVTCSTTHSIPSDLLQDYVKNVDCPSCLSKIRQDE